MFTLDLSTFPKVSDLNEAIKASPEFNPKMNSISGTLKWGEVISDVKVTIDKASLHPGAVYAGYHNYLDGSITVLNFGKAGNRRHRGGVVGTIYHEFFHHLQWYGTMADVGGWYFTNSNDIQDTLYNKHKEAMAGFYVGSEPAEASAEVFRVLAGYHSEESWETNNKMLKDYFEFFSKNQMIKYFMR